MTLAQIETAVKIVDHAAEQDMRWWFLGRLVVGLLAALGLARLGIALVTRLVTDGVDGIGAYEAEMRAVAYPFMRMTAEHDKHFGGGAALASPLAAALPATAQEWRPSRPLRFVIPYSRGGSTSATTPAGVRSTATARRRRVTSTGGSSGATVIADPSSNTGSIEPLCDFVHRGYDRIESYRRVVRTDV